MCGPSERNNVVSTPREGNLKRDSRLQIGDDEHESELCDYADTDGHHVENGQRVVVDSCNPTIDTTFAQYIASPLALLIVVIFACSSHAS